MCVWFYMFSCGSGSSCLGMGKNPCCVSFEFVKGYGDLNTEIVVVGVAQADDGGVDDFHERVSAQLKNIDSNIEVSKSYLQTLSFEGKLGQLVQCSVSNPNKAAAVMILGLGKAEDVNVSKQGKLIEVGYKIFCAAKKFEECGFLLFDSSLDKEVLAHIMMGVGLSSFKFDKYKSDSDKKSESSSKKSKLSKLRVVAGDDFKEIGECFNAQHLPVVNAIAVSRGLSIEPPNVLYPESYAETIVKLGKDSGFSVEILNQKDIEKLGMGALLGVARGSIHEARVAVMKWEGGARSESPIAFIGKGVTFDTGGYNIKPTGYMEDMNFDMIGSAVVVGLMKLLADRKAKVNAVGVVGIVENSVDGDAQRPSDVVTSMSGKTIQVLNTDAEGRLVLADILWYTLERFKPKWMIDLATLTGSVIICLGYQRAGIFSNDDLLADELDKAGEITGERVWRLPLGEEYDKLLDSDVADMKNIGGIRDRNASATVAAQFLQRFVGNSRWCHMDIAGVAYENKGVCYEKVGPTGYGIRLINELIIKSEENV